MSKAARCTRGMHVFCLTLGMLGGLNNTGVVLFSETPQVTTIKELIHDQDQSLTVILYVWRWF